MSELISNTSELAGRKASDFGTRQEPKDVLLCEPTYFNVIDVKNPHMQDQIGRVDTSKAQSQWQALREAVVRAGYRARLIEPTKELEDMVFTANPSLPGENAKGQKIVLLSNMKHPSRKKEVPAFEQWYRERGYEVHRLSNSNWNLEGMGDALWHPKRRLLWGGYGFRTMKEVYGEVSDLFSVPVVLVKLEREHFYHLDTCLCPLSETEALYYPEAFDANGKALVQSLFPGAIEVNEREAIEGFACNALAIDRNVFIQRGNVGTARHLTERGYKVVELETSEFMKSGGSVFCMKMMVYS